MTPSSRAEAVVTAPGPPFVGTRVDRSRSGKWMPTEAACSGSHLVVPVGPAQRRHRVFAPACAFENVSTSIDCSVDVARLAGHAKLVLDNVVVALQLLEAERPVFNSGAGGNPRRAVASDRLARRLEIPWAEPPALRPIVKRRAP